MFVLLMQFLWRYVEDLVGKGLSASVILEILLYASSSLVPMALPLAVLLASIMVFGNLAEHNELMAMKSAGISLVRMMQPLIVVAILISFFAFFFSNYILPYSNLKMRSLLYDVQNKPPEIIIPQGVFYNDLPGYSIKIEKKDKETKMLYGLMIYNHTQNKGNTSITVAEKGEMYYVNEHQYMILDLYNGAMYEDEVDKNAVNSKSYPLRRHTFEKQKLVFDLTGFGLKRSDESLFKNHYQMMGIKDLSFAIDTLTIRISEQKENFKQNIAKTNYFRRLTTSSLDTNNNLQFDKSLSIDSLFDAFSLQTKNDIISTATTFARNTQSYLQSEERSLNSHTIWKIKHGIEWHRKFTLSFACIILFFIGAPLGAIIRKGGIGMPVVVSVILFVMYYVIGMLGTKAAEQSKVTLWFGMWISTLVFTPIGIYLTLRALKDRVILNIDTHIAFLLFPFRFISKMLRVQRIRKIKHK